MSISAQIAVLCVLAAGIAGGAIWAYLRKGSTPEKRERQRRTTVNIEGRLGDALITEIVEETIYYTYSLRGVQYAASQDVSSIRHLLPAAPERLIGRSGLKYLTRNPANSILLCEEWSGLRVLGDPAALANRDVVGHQTENAALTEGS